MLQLAVRINDLHCAPPQHEGWAHQDRIAELFGDDECFSLVCGDAVRWLWNVELAQHSREELAVFGDLDALRRCADDVHAVLLQAQGKVEWRLPAELRDRTPTSITLVNV